MITRAKAILLVLAAATALPVLPAGAQQGGGGYKVPMRAGHQTQKAEFYKAPPELQILDERPIVHDFREAPQQSGGIQLPPPPQGFGGAGGGGSGALGGDGPGGGGGSGPYQIPGGSGPGYRNYNPGTSLPLPKADFGHAQTNIPSGGVGPKNVLPNGTTTGIHGKVMPINPNNPMMAGPAIARPSARPYVAPTPVAQYAAPGGGYGQSVASGNNRGGATAAVSGKLMTNLLNKQR